MRAVEEWGRIEDAVVSYYLQGMHAHVIKGLGRLVGVVNLMKACIKDAGMHEPMPVILYHALMRYCNAEFQ